tara:strand:- start:11831 stop:11998 length:168 start_codon:yes stop_codon:yes gene_type:complete
MQTRPTQAALPALSNPFSLLLTKLHLKAVTDWHSTWLANKLIAATWASDRLMLAY